MEASLDDPEATGLTAEEDSVRYGRVKTTVVASVLTHLGGCSPFSSTYCGPNGIVTFLILNPHNIPPHLGPSKKPAGNSLIIKMKEPGCIWANTCLYNQHSRLGKSKSEIHSIISLLPYCLDLSLSPLYPEPIRVSPQPSFIHLPTQTWLPTWSPVSSRRLLGQGCVGEDGMPSEALLMLPLGT